MHTRNGSALADGHPIGTCGLERCPQLRAGVLASADPAESARLARHDPRIRAELEAAHLRHGRGRDVSALAKVLRERGPDHHLACCRAMRIPECTCTRKVARHDIIR